MTPTFSHRVCIWRGFKTKCYICHVLCRVFRVRYYTYLCWCWNSLVWYHWFCYFCEFLLQKWFFAFCKFL